MSEAVLVVLLAVTLDLTFGEPVSRWHPVGWIGNLLKFARSRWRAAVRGFDGCGQRSDLEQRVLTFLGIQAPEEIMHRVYVAGLSRSELAAFAPTTLEVAASGDLVARQIVERGAEALAETIRVTAARINLVAPEIVMVGGILRSEVMLEPLRAHLLARLPEVRLVAAEQSPAHGACLLARALL